VGMVLAAALLAAAIGAAGRAAAQSNDEIDAMNERVVTLINAGRFAEALPLAERVIALSKARYGDDDPQHARALNNLAELLRATGRNAEAEPLLRRALAISERRLGANHPRVATSLVNLAELLRTTNRLAEAEPLYRRALAINERGLGPGHPSVATTLNNLALVLQATNRMGEAEPLLRRALAVMEKSLGPDHPNVASPLSNLAELLRATNRAAEAEPMHRRALAIFESTLGPDHPNVAVSLNYLVLLLQQADRLAEAEPLVRRALAIFERSLPPDHPHIATNLSNLAELLRATERFAEAEQLQRRALAMHEQSLGPTHPDVARDLNNLAGVLENTGRLSEAEALFRRALEIDVKNLGPEHPIIAQRLNNVAGVLMGANRLAEADPLYRRAIAIDEKSLGADHPNVAVYVSNLAVLRAKLGDWAEAARLHGRAVQIWTSAFGRGSSRHGHRDARAAARALHRAGGSSADGFLVAQWALQTGAAAALSQMAVRFAKGGGPLAAVVRQRQDLVAKRDEEEKRLLATLGQGDIKQAATVRSAIAGLDAQLGAIDRRLDAEFPEYTSFASPKPLAMAAVQGLLKDDEVLIAFLDVPGLRLGKLPGETLAWAVTRTEARWTSIPLDTEALAGQVARLRCGLDREGNWTWNQQRRRWEARDARCRALRPDGLAEAEALPFDVAAARELHAALLTPFADLTRGKSLLIVPSGPLTSLPLHVLVEDSPSPRATPASPRSPTAQGEGRVGGRPHTPTSAIGTAPHPDPLPASGERGAASPPAWLALKQAITVLPSVGSLQALRRLAPSKAKEPYIAFGNPLLDGDPQDADHREWAKLARAKQSCPLDLETLRPRVAAAARSIPILGAVVRGGGINVAALRAQTPLPETADELCRVAKALGALGRERETVWLGGRASEGNLKALSRAGKLARYRVLHFATHGLLAGESEAILKAKAEPALILNPPKDGATQTELEEDDGLLTASEVAQLDLDADWVVLSACNTGAGGNGKAEALAGLARAFFYAKARALLVSYWSADSDTGVKLTTNAFTEIAASPRIGRAEALRRSMARLIHTGGHEAQPEYWAPFVLVGEGAR
jgi:CHAT domain-containing protein/tetratricopeptide (TPR) repeat protein